MTRITAAVCGLVLGIMGINELRADTFGSGANQFTIDFVTVGNAGNADDAGAGGGIYSSPYGGVAYTFRMGVYEVSQDMITKATNLGMTDVTAGAWTVNQPAANITWYEAAAFVNWLNTSTLHQAAYNLSYSGGWSMSLWTPSDAGYDANNLYRNANAYYFLPSEDEWYKAAFHKNDGVTANYWDYPTGSNSAPDGLDTSSDTTFQAVFNDGYNQLHPNAITNAGSAASPYGTYGQAGNALEWMESALDGVNDSSTENRTVRGGGWGATEMGLRSESRGNQAPTFENTVIGFRVASIPEPSAALLMLGGLGTLLLKRHRNSSR